MQPIDEIDLVEQIAGLLGDRANWRWEVGGGLTRYLS